MYYMELKTKLIKFGNSFGIIIPSNLVKAKGFRKGEDVSVTVEGKGWTVGEIIGEARRQGLGKKFTLSTKELLDELDKELEPELFGGR